MSRRLLIVDDDSNIIDGLRDILEDNGYRVDSAMTAAEALALVEKNPPDAVLIDFNLPDSTGAALAAKLRGGRPALKLYLLTGFVPADLSIPPGTVDDVLTKPVPVEKLLQLLSTGLR